MAITSPQKIVALYDKCSVIIQPR